MLTVALFYSKLKKSRNVSYLIQKNVLKNLAGCKQIHLKTIILFKTLKRLQQPFKSVICVTKKNATYSTETSVLKSNNKKNIHEETWGQCTKL